MSSRVVTTLICACLLAVGCGEPPLFAESEDVDPNGWSGEDALSFQWEVSDTLQRQDVILDLRHAQGYPFSNLYLFLTYEFPNGKTRTDTVACTLADELGRWRGSGFGDLVDQRFLLQSQVAFPLSGSYHVKIAHGMREDPLTGLANVGLRLEAGH
jgi:gliding motility-associated lipoprotein GldH